MIVDLVQYFVQNHSNDEAIEAISILEDILESVYYPHIVKFISNLSFLPACIYYVQISA